MACQDETGLMKGYKFSRAPRPQIVKLGQPSGWCCCHQASVNAGVAPDFVKTERNLCQERLELEFQAHVVNNKNNAELQ